MKRSNEVTKEFIKRAKAGDNVFITDVREAYNNLPKEKRQTISCVVNLAAGGVRIFEINMPLFDGPAGQEREFVETYVRAEIFNIISTLGGRNVTLYVDTANKDLLKLAESFNDTFGIDESRDQRKGFGRCVNVIDRMLGAICDRGNDQGAPRFEFIVKDHAEMGNLSDGAIETAGDGGIFKKVAQKLDGKVICGMDIGGTDIKVALAVDGKLRSLKEYDWFPESFKQAQQLTGPICMLVRLVRANVSVDADDTIGSEEKTALQEQLAKAMDKDASYQFIAKVVTEVENVLADKIMGIDAIGLSFPDVVVKDKIVGGETTKTRGLRSNSQVDYEEEFAKMIDLDEQLLELCKPGGVVKNTNDGPMAAFTAAVEIAAAGSADQVRDGVFAHTLGTELGTGWVDGSGSIPEIPLECYNYIIDLGSFDGKEYPPDDVRSINNFNTGLTGTLQRYASQSGVFRLAVKYFSEQRNDLYQELLDMGFVVERQEGGREMLTVPTKPKDMRKAFLEHVMSLPERENDEVTREIFRQVGVFLAITWFETQRIARPASKARILFGRLVKNNYCFQLMLEGARSRKADLQMDVADGGMANTSLMKQLQADPHFTVAQFAQAVGAIYYGNMGLL
jgi:hypothetical protein